MTSPPSPHPPRSSRTMPPIPTPLSSTSSHHSLPPRPAVKITEQLEHHTVTTAPSRSSTLLTSGDEFATTIRGMSKLSTSDSERRSPVVKAPSQQYGKFGIIGEGVKPLGDATHHVRASTSSTPSRTDEPSLSPFSSTYSRSTPPTSVAPRSSSQSSVYGAQPNRRAPPIFAAGTGVQTETADEVGRYLMVCQVPRDVTAEELKAKFGSIAIFKAIVLKHLKTRGVVIVTFYDPREALKLYQWLHANSIRFAETSDMVALQCMKIEKTVVEEMMLNERVADEAWKASPSMVVCEVVGHQTIDAKTIRGLLAHFGALMWLQELSPWKYLAEYSDARQAKQAVEGLDTIVVLNSSLSISLRSEDVKGPSTIVTPPRALATATASESHLSTSTSATGEVGSRSMMSFSTPAQPTQHDVFWSPPTASSSALTSGYGTPVTPSTNTSPGLWPGSFDPFQASSPGAKHRSLPPPLKITPGYTGSPGWTSPYSNSQSNGRRLSHEAEYGMDRVPAPWEVYDRKRVPEQNVVRRDRILSGLDHRTTIMVKDVPNKLSRKELVAILDDTVPGGFDFVYLRFDFRNQCNVGYAFVNFTSVKSLYEFHIARVGKRWNMFSSDKVLQICYATIQGKQSLINKFRNSAVMDVIEEWRPQIFYSSGTRQGLPEPFPEADNPAQRHKSTAARLSSLCSPGVPHPQDMSEQYSYDHGYPGYGY